MGLALYRRLGFQMTPAAFPSVSLQDGAPPKPLGAGNSHADLQGSFVELVAVLDDPDRLPADSTLVPLEVPAEKLPRFVEVLNRTMAKVNSCLERFEGLHILVFRSPNIEAQAARLIGEGIGNSGIASVQRQVAGPEGFRTEVIRFIEIDDAATPEGRLAIASAPIGAGLHPNGAISVAGSILCVADDDLPAFTARYEKYINRAARVGAHTAVFDLEDSQMTLVSSSALNSILPGERAPKLPAFVAYAVTVRDIDLTRTLLLDNGFSVKVCSSGDMFVPADQALGAAVIFRPEQNS